MADKNVLLVEGKDDKHVFWHLLEHHQVPERFTIKDQDGILGLLDTLPVQLKASDLERLGIVVDANADLEARWQALRNILANAGYNDVPRSPDSSGTIIEQEDKPGVGVWLMPDNQIPGTLEDFCRFLVPSDEPLWDRAESCLQQIPENERRFPTSHWSKARIHTWLAWQEEPGRPLGTAITACYFDADAPHAHLLIDWIRQLFDLQE